MNLARRAPAQERLPVAAHAEASSVVAWRGGRPVRAAQFAHDVATVAAALPAASHILNACTDRYRFAVVFCRRSRVAW